MLSAHFERDELIKCNVVTVPGAAGQVQEGGGGTYQLYTCSQESDIKLHHCSGHNCNTKFNFPDSSTKYSWLNCPMTVLFIIITHCCISYNMQDGNTAYDLASFEGHTDVCQELLTQQS